MNGGFLPSDVLKKSTEHWNGTLHDVNHEGIGGWEMNILAFIGYHSNAKYDAKNKELSMDLHIKMNTHLAEAWKAFIDLCKEAGQVPNVSTTYRVSRTWVKASELPVNYKEYGLHADELVPYITEIFPAAVATVVIGRCSDKDGCGLGIKNECSCGCDIPEEKNDEIEQQRLELIRKIRELEDN